MRLAALRRMPHGGLDAQAQNCGDHGDANVGEGARHSGVIPLVLHEASSRAPPLLHEAPSRARRPSTWLRPVFVAQARGSVPRPPTFHEASTRGWCPCTRLRPVTGDSPRGCTLWMEHINGDRMKRAAPYHYRSKADFYHRTALCAFY